MNFSRSELTTLRHAVAIAIVRNSQQIKRAKKKENPKPGEITSLAAEYATYACLWDRFKKEIDETGKPLPPPKGPHECPHCHWGFATPEILAVHIQEKH